MAEAGGSAGAVRSSKRSRRTGERFERLERRPQPVLTARCDGMSFRNDKLRSPHETVGGGKLARGVAVGEDKARKVKVEMDWAVRSVALPNY